MARCQSLSLSVRKAELAKTELVNKGLAKEIGAKLGKSKRLKVSCANRARVKTTKKSRL